LNTRFLIGSPLKIKNGRTLLQEAELLLQQGFTRLEINNQTIRIDDLLKENTETGSEDSGLIIIDRATVSDDEDNLSRIADSVQTAFFEGHGECVVKIYLDNEVKEEHFSNLFEADGIEFEEPTVHMFSFNNPVGACKTCEGYGKVIGIDEDLIIPNKSLSIYQDAVVCWKGEKMSEWKDELVYSAEKFGFPIHKPFYELTGEQKKLLWTGNQHFQGLDKFFKMLEENLYKIQYRVMLSRYRGKTNCPDCLGTRLKKEAMNVKVDGQSIQDLVLLPINQLQLFFKNLKLSAHETQIAERILTEINNRLEFLTDVGLGYLTLNRLSSTLSGGESQRINLATSLGSSLVGSMYILKEPRIGLHSRDTERLAILFWWSNTTRKSCGQPMKSSILALWPGVWAGRLFFRAHTTSSIPRRKA